MYVWYRMIWYVRITLTCNTAASVPRAVCSSLRSPVQHWKNMRTVPSRRENKNVPPVPSKKTYRPFLSWKKLHTVPSRREKLYAPSRPVEQKIYTVPSRRDNFYLPSRPLETIFTYRPVPSWQFLFTVPSRHGTKRSLYCTDPSRQGNSYQPSRPVPSRQL